jgi:hypothetical protein
VGENVVHEILTGVDGRYGFKKPTLLGQAAVLIHEWPHGEPVAQQELLAKNACSMDS